MKVMTTFGSSSTRPESELYKEIEQIGSILARHEYVVMNGGYSGTMEAACKGAASKGGWVIGITSRELERLFPQKKANPYLSEEIKKELTEERTNHLIQNATAITIFDGGSGTQYEWVKAYEFMNSGFIDAKPIIFYRAAPEVRGFVEYLCERGRNKKEVFHFAGSIREYKTLLDKLDD